MTSLLTAVMYHYVRPTLNSPYPGIKAMDLQDFRAQLNYFERDYHVVSLDDVANAMEHNQSLPERSLLLTFDDGLSDHYEHVFPELKKRGLFGAFYTSGATLNKNIVLEVHKIHHILAAIQDYSAVIRFIHAEIEQHQHLYSFKTIEHYQAEFAKANAWDSADVIYIKRLLQHALPDEFRKKIIDVLFERYVSEDLTCFSNSFYLNSAQLTEMIQEGMHIGGHSYTHPWLSTLKDEEQEKEILQCKAFLQELPSQPFLSFCYPYGSYNAKTVELLQKHGFSMAFTTHRALANLHHASPFELARFDTNDFPMRC